MTYRDPVGTLHMVGYPADGLLLGERLCTSDDLGQVVVHHPDVVAEPGGGWTCLGCGMRVRPPAPGDPPRLTG